MAHVAFSAVSVPPVTAETTAREHVWHIDEREYARHEARRGRRHAYERVEPARTALVVVDLVRFFVEENPHCRGVVPNVNRLSASLRSAGGTVAWVLPGAETPRAAELEFFGTEVAAAYARTGGDGPLRARLWPALDVSDDDVLVEKFARSAFFPGRCSLPETLEARGIDTVLVAGTVTNVCCESTVRDASTLGYRVVMVADANAAVSDETHNATLTTVYRSFGDVRTTEELIALLASSGGDAAG